ncbi:thioredoxin family protein [Dyadobacter sp. CY261]|uniref:thioredoxin family protein n=1 Tax=Dyadobacter sp. CY261 TaxID=2907203 RepID=UPI001F20EC79|nr:thioredoxin family protein [Dyadobacter sp. CY261]MCF0075307.1 thioredoxin family protein [Dyadobacter sp. CY261]
MNLLTTLMLAFLSSPLGDWKLNFAEAKTQANADHKMILLNFSGSDWCGPCIKLKKEVFESEVFVSYASEKLVLVRADFPRQKKNQLSKEQVAHNEDLADRYNPKGLFPLTVLIDSKGKVIREWEGFPTSSETFLSDLRSHSGSR